MKGNPKDIHEEADLQPKVEKLPPEYVSDVPLLSSFVWRKGCGHNSVGRCGLSKLSTGVLGVLSPPDLRTETDPGSETLCSLIC
jgi:hypothetical protein